MQVEANWSKPARFNALDAIVLAELDAVTGRRPPPPRRGDVAEEEASADAFEASQPEDEESFIERTADYLRQRPDADALLEAVRSLVREHDGEGEMPSPVASSEEHPADEQT